MVNGTTMTNYKRTSNTNLSSKPVPIEDQRLLGLNSPSVACYFEVHGRVQCVAFRKYTKRQAKALCLRGWCANTVNGTVRGELQGPAVQVTVMQNWLRWRGSPRSRVHRVVFGQLRPIDEYTYRSFEVKWWDAEKEICRRFEELCKCIRSNNKL